MSTSAKIFLLVLFLLAVFFLVGLGLSVHHKSDSTNKSRDDFKSTDYPWLEKMGHVFSARSPEITPVGNGCLSYVNSRIRIRPSSACELTVGPAKPLMGIIPPPSYRSVKFTVVTGTISFKHAPEDRLNKGDPDDPKTWNPNDDGSLSVDQDGGRLVLRCGGPGVCELKLQ